MTKNDELSLFMKCSVILCLSVFLLTRFYGLAIVSGESMEPTFVNGDIVLVTKGIPEEGLRRGDIAVIKDGRSLLVKRIVAVPGDTTVIKDGALFVNGQKEESVDTAFAGLLSSSYMTGKGEYIVLGDNRAHSRDSRAFGPIQEDRFKGIVIRKIY